MSRLIKQNEVVQLKEMNNQQPNNRKKNHEEKRKLNRETNRAHEIACSRTQSKPNAKLNQQLTRIGIILLKV